MTQAPARAVVPVAVGVVFGADGAVLLADRPAGKAYAGYWEFPGGKVEPGESVEHALARELAEELHIEVAASLPWLTFDFDYPHAYVRLYFRRVVDWHGTPVPAEGQRLMFHKNGQPAPQPLLPAARPVMRWLQLPDCLPLAADALSGPQPREVAISTMRWQVATVRDAHELALAAARGADCAVTPALSEPALAELAQATPIPLYAPAPVGADGLARMRRLGLHGLWNNQE